MTATSSPLPALVSVIVPVWRGDAAHVASMWQAMQPGSPLRERVELIVSAAEVPEVDLTRLKEETAAMVIRCGAAGRGSQLHAGALAASGRVLLFQHVDTPMNDAHLHALAAAIGSSDTESAPDGDWIGGAFHRDLARMFPPLRPAIPLVRCWHRHAGLLLGDQSVFVRREVYYAMGGFRPLALMEDVEFSRRLRRQGPLLLLDPPVRHSLRRFEGKTWWQRQHLRLLNAWLLLRFSTGADPAKLHSRYYKDIGAA